MVIVIEFALPIYPFFFFFLKFSFLMMEQGYRRCGSTTQRQLDSLGTRLPFYAIGSRIV